MRVRVVVYNVHGFREGLGRVAAVIRRFEPDLVLLNETAGRWRLRRLARAVGMRAAGDPWSPFRRRVKNAVLVRPPWTMARRRLIRFPGSRRFYPRGALVALVERPGARTWAVAVHLGLRPGERRRHAEKLVDAIGHLDGPVLLGGDMNELPDRGAAKTLGDRLGDAWLLGGDVAGGTFPAEEPTARIDYLFVSEDVRVDRVLVPSAAEVRIASDHLPVLAEVVLEGTLGPGTDERAG
jgi:endonuclease/exonuclease/phosphatase family metal-dependent hydrolase